MLKFHPYSILTGDTMVGFVIFCVLRPLEIGVVGQELHKKTFLDSEMRLAADAEMQFCLRETNLGSGGIISNKEFLVH